MAKYVAFYKSITRLDGKTAIVTGSNTGIGKCTVQDFYKRGARVIMACRSVERAKKAADDIIQASKGESRMGSIVIQELDLSNLKSVRECAKKLLKEEDHIELLVNNAGVCYTLERKTVDGFETHFAVNHLGHFLFTLLLLPRIIKSKPARIITVSSFTHSLLIEPINFEDLNWDKRTFDPFQGYCQSKLANLLFTKELARKLQNANIENVTTYSIHPGEVETDILRNCKSVVTEQQWNYICERSKFFITSEQGAQTILYCALDERLGNQTGMYYENCQLSEPSSAGNNMEDAALLWDISKEMVKLDPNYNPFIPE